MAASVAWLLLLAARTMLSSERVLPVVAWRFDVRKSVVASRGVAAFTGID